MKAQYFIKLTEGHSWTDTYWDWVVSYDGEVLAEGVTEFRWTAKRAAQKAAKRHAAGKPAQKPGRPGDDAYYYDPEA